MKISFLIEIPASGQKQTLTDLFTETPDFNIKIIGDEYRFFAWGDPICNDTFFDELPAKRSPGFIAESISGHYYYLLIDHQTGETVIGTSLFSILPVYYCKKDGKVFLSDNVFTLARHTGLNTPSPRFVIESLLFNYPLFNHSLVDGISLLDSNSVLVTGGAGIHVVKHTEVDSWFSRNPEPWKRSMGKITDIFLSNVEKYLPEEHYLTALTGGFDGRTLTAAGLYHKRNITCFCFGSDLSGDLGFATDISSKAGIPFRPVLLDGEYVNNFSLEAGRNFILNTSGCGTFARAHYIYSAELLSRLATCLVSGNFGSEIFRTAHTSGVMIAPELYRVFTSEDPDKAMELVKKNPVLKLLNQDMVYGELNGLKEDILRLPCFNSHYDYLDRNMQFYIFVFEEVFRKYFGSEILAQWKSVITRTPFLDRTFLMELLSTGLAGIHAGFMEKNPLRRFKGQVLYASVIRKAAPHLGRFVADKGYSPDDLLSLSGKLRITGIYLRKRKLNTASLSDPMAVREAWSVNRGFFESLPLSGSVFNESEIARLRSALFTNEKARLYSLIFALNNIPQAKTS